MTDAAQYLAAYDRQLRTAAETSGAVSVAREGPVWLAVFPGGRGFVTYADLGGADSQEVHRLVARTLTRLRDEYTVGRIEWKTRGHDHAPGLHDALTANGFAPDEPESIMVGQAAGLVADIVLPAGVTLHQVSTEAEVLAMEEMQGEVFADPDWRRRAAETLDRLGCGEGVELWVARADGRVVAAGRLEPVGGTDFAGLWGGATRPEWRGRGIYRALTAERARSALAHGKTLLHSDSSEFSRPILERAGLIKVSTTTPYRWRQAQP